MKILDENFLFALTRNNFLMDYIKTSKTCRQIAKKNEVCHINFFVFGFFSCNAKMKKGN